MNTTNPAPAPQPQRATLDRTEAFAVRHPDGTVVLESLDMGPQQCWLRILPALYELGAVPADVSPSDAVRELHRQGFTVVRVRVAMLVIGTLKVKEQATTLLDACGNPIRAGD